MVQVPDFMSKSRNSISKVRNAWGCLSLVTVELRKAMTDGVAFNIHMSGTNRVCCVLHLENST